MVVGDWNIEPPTLKKFLDRRGIDIHIDAVPGRGPRMDLTKGVRSKRVIDYAVSTTKGIIVKQKTLSYRLISYYICVMVTTSLISRTRSPYWMHVFQRDKLADVKIESIVDSIMFEKTK
ncbi:hypothetical protein NUSPORA_02603 [Nucleospora cyclopteri]